MSRTPPKDSSTPKQMDATKKVPKPLGTGKIAILEGAPPPPPDPRIAPRSIKSDAPPREIFPEEIDKHSK